MAENKEMLCEHCAHREICKFKDEFLRATKTVNETEVLLPIAPDQAYTVRSIKLHDISWIEPVKLVCKHYQCQNQYLAKDAQNLHLLL